MEVERRTSDNSVKGPYGTGSSQSPLFVVENICVRPTETFPGLPMAFHAVHVPQVL